MTSSGPDEEVKYARYQAVGVAWSLGWPIATAVVAGSWLDARLGTSPLFILALALGGLVVTVRRLMLLGPPGSGGHD